MNMYTLRVSLLAQDKELFDQGSIPKEITWFEKALLEAATQVKNSNSIPVNEKNEPKYSLKISVKPDSNNVMAGVVSKANKFHGHDAGFEEYDIDNYPPLIWIWDRVEQVLLVEKKANVFRTPNAVCKCFEKLANNIILAEIGLRVELKPVLDDAKCDFWSEYDNFEFVEKIEFELIPPNLFGETEQSMKDALNDITEQTNANHIKTTFENVSGKLKLSSKGWVNNAVRWIKKGGGDWKMWGRKVANSPVTDVSSYKSAKITFINGQLSEADLQGYDSTELAHLISHYQNEYTYKDNTDDD
ncbi:hypothetical protein [Pseudoalteromonas sp. NZS11]|uniref:hypothetical protein n=1 Tax=Pseudoalteromonas sp. NZS11 TaxID=2792049 RepID=UPI0018CDF7E4|nr:hypothetical protein [Pseudoalteromonas sp. NZS11]MBH0078991.1 hypothetical protein [Pseudoalteromonas sp. NZS11]